VSRPLLDVSDLPNEAFGHRSALWWGTMGLIAIEGTMFALLITNYLYLKGRNYNWPPGVEPPDLLWGTVNTIVLIASAIPNELTKQAAKKYDLSKVQLWIVVCLMLGVVFNVIRIFEFMSLNVWWDQNAYGSIVWTLLGFHTVHILTDFIDTAVLALILFLGPVEEKRFVDVYENAMYWYFVLIAWLPIYALIYFAPRVA
jgi:cytochrome c oxidase subunit III